MPPSLNQQIKQIEDLLEYLELMSALVMNFDYWEMLRAADTTRLFIQIASRFELSQILPQKMEVLERQAKVFMKDYPPRMPLDQIVEKFKEAKSTGNILNNGVTFQFLDNLMDVKKLMLYADAPYHFRIAIGPLKGGGGVEEEFLLKDAFILLRRAEENFELLLKASPWLKNRDHPDTSIHGNVTDVKYDVANYSRQSVLTFFSFIECLVNSMAFNHLYRFEKSLSEEQIRILKGLKKNGSYMSLKHRIEAMQTVIRDDGKVVLKVVDEQQRTEPFVQFFDHFEALRNASVHYSPIKERIWLGPDKWVGRARDFCDIALKVGLLIWKACYPDSDGPLYMGKLDKKKQIELANHRLYAGSELKDLIGVSG